MWPMTKKRSSEIFADENGKFFREKVKFLEFSRKSEKFSKIGGNLKHGEGNASWPQGGWTPLTAKVKNERKIKEKEKKEEEEDDEELEQEQD